MKKIIVSLVIAGSFLVALGTAVVVKAQGPDQQVEISTSRMGGGGMRGGTGGAEIENGAVHELMMSAYAEKLHLSVDELNTRTATGETLSQIALSTGMNFSDFWVLKTEITESVVSQALSQGLITQVEADQMQTSLSRGMRGGGVRGNNNAAGSYCGSPLPVNP
ncbi:MAG: hypothetical protein NTZ74_12520 [Chloroflexi bacterium]|nr:hypothetical protein [Chloroflexota bacterium]